MKVITSIHPPVPPLPTLACLQCGQESLHKTATLSFIEKGSFHKNVFLVLWRLKDQPVIQLKIKDPSFSHIPQIYTVKHAGYRMQILFFPYFISKVQKCSLIVDSEFYLEDILGSIETREKGKDWQICHFKITCHIYCFYITRHSWLILILSNNYLLLRIYKSFPQRRNFNGIQHFLSKIIF